MHSLENESSYQTIVKSLLGNYYPVKIILALRKIYEFSLTTERTIFDFIDLSSLLINYTPI